MEHFLKSFKSNHFKNETQATQQKKPIITSNYPIFKRDDSETIYTINFGHFFKMDDTDTDLNVGSFGSFGSFGCVQSLGYDENLKSTVKIRNLFEKLYLVQQNDDCIKKKVFKKRIYIKEKYRYEIQKFENAKESNTYNFYKVNNINNIIDFGIPNKVELPIIRLLGLNVTPLENKMPLSSQHFDIILEQKVESYIFYDSIVIDFITEFDVNNTNIDNEVYKIKMTTKNINEKYRELFESLLSLIVYEDIKDEYEDIYQLIQGFV